MSKEYPNSITLYDVYTVLGATASIKVDNSSKFRPQGLVRTLRLIQIEKLLVPTFSHV